MDGVDREESEVGLGLGIAEEVDVDKFFDFEDGGGDIFDYVGEELGAVGATRERLLVVKEGVCQSSWSVSEVGNVPQ